MLIKVNLPPHNNNCCYHFNLSLQPPQAGSHALTPNARGCCTSLLFNVIHKYNTTRDVTILLIYHVLYLFKDKITVLIRSQTIVYRDISTYRGLITWLTIKFLYIVIKLNEK